MFRKEPFAPLMQGDGPTYGGGSFRGGVDNTQMTIDAKARQIVRTGIDLTTANVVLIGGWMRSKYEIIEAKLILEDSALTGNCGITLGSGPLSSGTPVDADDIGTISVTAAGSAEGDVETFTLASTLKTNGYDAGSKGLPQLDAGQLIYATLDGTPTGGNGAIVITIMPLDESVE